MNRKILKLSLIKSLIFNLHYFGLAGLKFPVLVSKTTKLERIGGKVELDHYKFGSVKIGFGPIQATYGKGRWYNTGTIIFSGEAHLYEGFFIYNNGILVLGENVKLGASKFFCEEKITIGKDTMISWECTVMDSDLHKICDKEGNRVNENKEIKIGAHVWIGFGCSVLKGTSIADETIIASNSFISNKDIRNSNTIYGSHGNVLKNEIDWFWELK